jgi:hypothetical protein
MNYDPEMCSSSADGTEVGRGKQLSESVAT